MARKLRLRRRRGKDDSEKVLAGLKDVAKEKDSVEKEHQEEEEMKKLK